MNTESDKVFWHRYAEFYDQFLEGMNPQRILEFGVFHGASIRMWRHQYPSTYIVGADILEQQPDWPTDPLIHYERIDQGDDHQIESMFDRLGRKFDLIVEDGSHIPTHQARCLALALPHLSAGGVYILEDIHTSHFDHPYSRDRPHALNALNVLLAIQNLRDISRVVDAAVAESLAEQGFFSPEEIASLDQNIDQIALYRRTKLPLRCYACDGANFDYGALKCSCGVPIFGNSDSMTFVLTKK